MSPKILPRIDFRRLFWSALIFLAVFFQYYSSHQKLSTVIPQTQFSLPELPFPKCQQVVTLIKAKNVTPVLKMF